MQFNILEGLRTFVMMMPGFLLAISVHEAAHAWVANRLGDGTAKSLGRVSLNPIAHIDPIGTLIMPALIMILNAPVIGWGKPVPVDYRNLRDYKKDGIWISAAGPISNLLMAFAFGLLLKLIVVLDGWGWVRFVPMSLLNILAEVFSSYVVLNVVLFVFNLLPVHPLDGSKILFGLLPMPMASQYDAVVSRVGPILLLVLVFTGILGKVLSPLVAGTLSLINVLLF